MAFSIVPELLVMRRSKDVARHGLGGAEAAD